MFGVCYCRMIGEGDCSKCGRSVICWGNLLKELCMSCDEKENQITLLTKGDSNE